MASFAGLKQNGQGFPPWPPCMCIQRGLTISHARYAPRRTSTYSTHLVRSTVTSCASSIAEATHTTGCACDQRWAHIQFSASGAYHKASNASERSGRTCVDACTRGDSLTISRSTVTSCAISIAGATHTTGCACDQRWAHIQFSACGAKGVASNRDKQTRASASHLECAKPNSGVVWQLCCTRCCMAGR